MVIAMLCPVHGPQRSRVLGAMNAMNVQLKGNIESCPEPGCIHMGPVVDGTFNFIGGETQVISAPKWSIAALQTVSARIGRTVRILADPKVSDAVAEEAVQAIAAEVAKAVEGLSDDIAKKITESLKPSSSERPKGWRKQTASLMAIAAFLLTNYSGVKDSVGEMIEDGSAIVAWAEANAHEVPKWFKDVAPWLADDSS